MVHFFRNLMFLKKINSRGEVKKIEFKILVPSLHFTTLHSEETFAYSGLILLHL